MPFRIWSFNMVPKFIKRHLWPLDHCSLIPCNAFVCFQQKHAMLFVLYFKFLNTLQLRGPNATFVLYTQPRCIIKWHFTFLQTNHNVRLLLVLPIISTSLPYVQGDVGGVDDHQARDQCWDVVSTGTGSFEEFQALFLALNDLFLTLPRKCLCLNIKRP